MLTYAFTPPVKSSRPHIFQRTTYKYSLFQADSALKCANTVLDGDSGQNDSVENDKLQMRNDELNEVDFIQGLLNNETLPSYIARIRHFNNILSMQLNIVAKRYMTKKAKLIRRFRRIPVDFSYYELVKLLDYFGYHEVSTGKTSGSRVRFMNKEGTIIMFHKPHSGGIVKRYQLKQIKEVLGL